MNEAEKYFYELTSETLKQERIHAVSRGVIWSVELVRNSDTWEQYSFKLNGVIEDAFLKQHRSVRLSCAHREITRCLRIMNRIHLVLILGEFHE